MWKNRKPKKIAFFDLDGTLVSHKINAVPESARRTLLSLQKKGILVVLATGRHEMELKKLPGNDIPFDGYLTLNGQFSRDKDGRILYESPLCKEDVAAMHALFMKKEIPVLFKEKERIYINFVNDRVVQTQKEINTPVPVIGEYMGDAVYQVVVFIDKDKEDQILQLLKESTITRWNSKASDVVPKSGGKGKGIMEYLHSISMTQEDAMAFGDGHNDLDMLQVVSLGICMGNGEDCVKEIADYVTDTVDCDGIEKAMLALGYLSSGS